MMLSTKGEAEGGFGDCGTRRKRFLAGISFCGGFTISRLRFGVKHHPHKFEGVKHTLGNALPASVS